MDELNFSAGSWSLFDAPVDAENIEAVSTTPDFVAMCDLLSTNDELNSILYEDLNHG